MKKRMISVALVLAMALSMTMTVSAEDWESEIDTLGVAAVGNTYYQTVQEAVNNAGSALVKLVADAAEETVTNSGTLNLDLNGFDVKINGGTVNLIDTTTDDGKTVGGKLSGTVEIAQNVTKYNNISYLARQDNGAWTANAVRVQLTKVSIRPATTSAGIYYTTSFAFNKNVVDAGATYGVVLSATDAPDAEFETDDANGDDKIDNLWTAIDAKADANFAQNGNSCLLANIFTNKEGVDAAANAIRGAEEVFANAYVKVGDATIMAENTTDVVYSIKTIMQAFNKKLEEDKLVDPAKTNILNFYGNWKDAMEDWGLTSIDTAYAELNNSAQ